MVDYVWLVVTGTLLIGSLMGMLILALISSGKTEDLYKDNEGLRQAEQLLKEEISKLESDNKSAKQNYHEEGKQILILT